VASRIKEIPEVASQETCSKSWRTSLGCFARILRRALAGPSGCLLSCSQFCRVSILIPIRDENCFWVSPRYLPKAAISPVIQSPEIRRRLCSLVIARPKSFFVSSRTSSVIGFTCDSFFIPLLLYCRCKSCADQSNDVLVIIFNRNNDNHASENRPNRNDPIFRDAMLEIILFQNEVVR